jgi:branched-chain amino acid transport system permease protein
MAAAVTASRLTGRLVVGLVLAVLAIAPFVLQEFEASLIAEILIWSILAMALDLLFGYTGMLSFGQALFFGVGAYGMAFAAKALEMSLLPALACAVVAGGLAAAITGFFAVRLSWHYFAIITIIFSLVVYFFAVSRSDLTGGDDGLPVTVPPIATIGGTVLTVYEPVVEYYLVLVLAGTSFVALRILTRTQIGLTFCAIRDNATRAALLGYDTFRYRWLAFVIAGLFSGLAGGLFAMKTRYASAAYLFWTVSGDAVIWTVVGGAGTLVGPVVGTALLIGLRDYVSAWFEHYLVVIGLIAIVIVLVAPQGLVGLLRSRAGRA